MNADPLTALARLPADPDEALSAGELKTCCAAVYEHPAVRWLLGGELHPGGAETTRRALELTAVGAGDRLLDVASGSGSSALLAARERGCEVVGVEYGGAAVARASAGAEADGLDQLVSFMRGDAESLPLPDASFDAVLCECSLCTFPDKALAAAEFRRVLHPGGSVAITDVVADPERLPDPLRGSLASIACVASALPLSGYQNLLRKAGLDPRVAERRDGDAAAFALGIEDRLRGARLLGLDRLAGSPIGVDDALELIALAREAIADGALGYVVLSARAR